jgi:hypothetical protein
VTGASGWKERSPSLVYNYVTGNGDGGETLDVRRADVGLSDIARHVETDSRREKVGFCWPMKRGSSRIV